MRPNHVSIMAPASWRRHPRGVCADQGDLKPGHLDFLVNITDALRALRAFTGINYPFTPTDPPCP